jgi:uncharacterized protein
VVEKREGREAPVGTVIFDPDGEYYWPDDKGRPGLCDVPALQDRLVVFTDKDGPSEFYRSFVVDKVRLDIRELEPAKVISWWYRERLAYRNAGRIPLGPRDRPRQTPFDGPAASRRPLTR